MKQAIIELPDNFEKGDCCNCPFSYFSYAARDGYDDTPLICILYGKLKECELKIKEDENE